MKVKIGEPGIEPMTFNHQHSARLTILPPWPLFISLRPITIRIVIFVSVCDAKEHTYLNRHASGPAGVTQGSKLPNLEGWI